MPKRKLTMGIGATASCLTNKLHPTEVVCNKYNNVTLGSDHRTEGLVTVRVETKTINRRQQSCYVFTHSDYVDAYGNLIELHTAKSNIKQLTEGCRELFFPQDGVRTQQTRSDAIEVMMLPEEVLNFTAVDDDFAVLRRNGVEVDDDNEPEPENVTTFGTLNQQNVFTAWGFGGICHRKKLGITNVSPTLPNVDWEERASLSRVQLFELFFPKQYIINVIIPETNNQLDDKMDYAEFIMFIGLWFLMATVEGCQLRDFWSNKPVDRFTGAPFRISDLMDQKRFLSILKAIKYTRVVDDENNDNFRDVRELIAAWNKNMTENFVPGWINCVDKSMSPWTNKYTCPGFMFVPSKPWPFGNQYHSICCCMTGIMYFVEIIEGKSCRKGVVPEFEDRGGKTVGLLLRITKPIHHRGCVVVLDSRFCVLNGIAELRRSGVFAVALIKKKRQCWPKYIDGDAVTAYFNYKEVGSVDCMQGELNGQAVNLICMKEPDDVLMLMSSYGTLNEVTSHPTARTYTAADGTAISKAFNYTEVVSNYYKYRQFVNDHNSNRHQPICFENIWKTEWWPNRVFSFLLGVTEVNIKMAHEYFTRSEVFSLIDFRKSFAQELIVYATTLKQGTQVTRSYRKPEFADHEKISMPKNRSWNKGKFVTCKTIWSQRRCFGCKTKTRTYCKCSPERALCDRCYIQHLFDLDIHPELENY